MTDEKIETGDVEGDSGEDFFSVLSAKAAENLRKRFRKYEANGKRLEELERRLKEEFFDDVVEAVKPQIATVLADIIDDQGKLESTVASISGKIDDVTGRLDDCLSDFEAIRSEAERSGGEMRTLNEIYTRLERKYAQLEGDVGNLRDSNKGLLKAMGKVYGKTRAMVAALKTDLVPINVEINGIKKSIVELKRHIDKEVYVEESIETALDSYGSIPLTGPLDNAVESLAGYAGLLAETHRGYIIDYMARSLVQGGAFKDVKHAEKYLKSSEFTKDISLTLSPPT